jgi:CelD/BcsL family acetyltransferase involved in cellulose biosynthesis
LEVTILDDFETVPVNEWEDLWQRTERACVYQTWSWYYWWAKHFAKRGSMRIMLVRCRGRLVGAAPLYICSQIRYGIFNRKALTFLSSSSYAYPLYQEPLIDSEIARDLVIALLAERISTLKGFDVISFEHLTSDSLAMALLHELKRRTGKDLIWQNRITSHVVRLPSTYQDFVGSLGSRTRKNLRYYTNRFLLKPGHMVKVVGSADDMLKLVDALCDQKIRRFASIGRKSTFSDVGFRMFLKNVCISFLNEERVLGLMAMIDGLVVATQLILLDRHGHAFGYNSSYDLDYEDWRIPYVLESLRLEIAIQKGYRSMDLSSGYDQHKEHWSQGNVSNLMEGMLVVRPIGNMSFWILDHLKKILNRFRLVSINRSTEKIV